MVLDPGEHLVVLGYYRPPGFLRAAQQADAMTRFNFAPRVPYRVNGADDGDAVRFWIEREDLGKRASEEFYGKKRQVAGSGPVFIPIVR